MKRAAIVLSAVALVGCGGWARAERVALHTGADVSEPGPFFDRVLEAARASGYETLNENRAAGTFEVPANQRPGPDAGSFVVRVFLDGSVEVIARGQERRRRSRRGRPDAPAPRVIRSALYEESLRFADRLARNLDAVAMTEPLALRRVEGEE